MLKTAVIGAGSMGRHHVRNYAEIPTSQLIGLADPDEARSELAEKHGCGFFTDYRALLDQKPDLITIAAPTTLHYQIANDALDAGCHLLIEKPVSDDLEKARALMAKASEKKLKLAVGHIERFNPAVMELKRIIESGELGEVLSINNLRVGPYHGRILDTGIILDLGTHDVDLISYLFNERCHSVFATATKRKHNHEDHAVLQLGFGQGHTGIIQTSWLAPYRARNVFVVGTEHFALCDLMNQLILVYDDNPEGNNLLAGLRPVPDGEPLKNELTSVIANVMEDTEPLCTAEDSIYALSVCKAALQSVESGRSQDVV
ncbi:MAG: Gfo/Idh/MocA family oxidoreductase [Planctomycetales bacterium]|nr:Gfo/Idh/MocA family oxidoreductase [bacterium]UNM09023.1 MAG: Gfo/Idh/MocA family oxidoreductase [Planctomycetales bacterium]